MHANSTILENGAIPLLRYRDLSAAITWLCAALGFEKHLVLHDDDGEVRYAQLTLGNSMVMLSPVNDSIFDNLMVQPDQISGAETQSAYFFVPDSDAHYTHAKSFGADIVLDMTDERGKRGYSCRDPEGHLWNFGSVDPWSRQLTKVRRKYSAMFANALSASMSAVIGGLILAAGCMDVANHPRPIATRVAGWSAGYADGARRLLTQQLRGEVGQSRVGEEEAAEVSSSEDFRRTLMRERTAREAAERAVLTSRAELARLQAENEAAESSLREARELLANERNLRLASQREYSEGLQRANQQARSQLARPPGEEELTAITARARRERLAKERTLRLAAARSHREAQRSADLARSAGRPQALQNRYFNFSR